MLLWGQFFKIDKNIDYADIRDICKYHTPRGINSTEPFTTPHVGTMNANNSSVITATENSFKRFAKSFPVMRSNEPTPQKIVNFKELTP